MAWPGSGTGSRFFLSMCYCPWGTPNLPETPKLPQAEMRSLHWPATTPWPGFTSEARSPTCFLRGILAIQPLQIRHGNRPNRGRKRPTDHTAILQQFGPALKTVAESEGLWFVPQFNPPLSKQAPWFRLGKTSRKVPRDSGHGPLCPPSFAKFSQKVVVDQGSFRGRQHIFFTATTQGPCVFLLSFCDSNARPRSAAGKCCRELLRNLQTTNPNHQQRTS